MENNKLARAVDDADSTASAVDEGWVMLFNSRKWHYFRNSRALCGGWMYLGSTFDDEERINSPQNCAGCRRRRVKELAALTDSKDQGGQKEANK